MPVFYWLFCGFLLVTFRLTSQVGMMDSLPVIEVVELRNGPDEALYCPTTTIVQLPVQQSLADVLTEASGIFIKSYGLGSLATSSWRGGSAGHTTVLWNGLPLDNPMLGLLDLSQLPVSFFEDVRLESGGRSANWGSGAIAGAIQLNNLAADANGVDFSLTGGSFGFAHLNGNGYFVSPNQKWRFTTKLLHNESDNDFSYQLRADQPAKKQEHAEVQQLGGLQEVYYSPQPNETFHFRIWGQTTDRNLPPTTVQSRSLASQEDDFLRLGLGWKKTTQKHHLTANAGLFRETVDYRDPAILLRSVSHFWRAALELEDNWYANDRHRFAYGLSGQWLNAETDAYGTDRTQIRLAPFAAYRYTFKRGEGRLNVRQETVDGKLLPLAPSASFRLGLLKKLDFHGSISRNYRLPTLNDLFWRPGGNPDLLPENGWSQELGLLHEGGHETLSWRYQITAYHRLLNNWIQWAPAGNFWSAYNLTKVRSRGVEQRFSVDYRRQKLRLRWQLGYDFTLSTNEVAIEVPRLVVGEQLAYVPRHQAYSSLQLVYGQLDAAYQHRLVSKVNGQNVEELDGYHLGGLRLGYRRPIGTLNLRFFVEAENLWNVDYRIIERRVMPGRNGRMGVAVKIN